MTRILAYNEDKHKPKCMTDWVRRNTRALRAVAILVAVGVFVIFIPDVLAQSDIESSLALVNEGAGLGTTDIRVIIANIVRVFLGVVGIIAFGFILYAGFLWMTSQGDAAKVEKAQKIMINAGIGLVIILSSLAITQFVLSRLLEATTGGAGTSDDAVPELITPLSSALGTGIIDTHFPPRNANGVARNTNIVVTFREEIDPSSVITGYDPANPSSTTTLDTGAVKIYPTEDGEALALDGAEVVTSHTEDLKTFVFNPVGLLGNAADDMSYTVALTDDIKLADGDDAFSGAFSGYEWRFTVSTEIDLTPPRVTSVVPVLDTTNPRNILVQVNYSEAVNPVSAVGSTPGFTNLTVNDPALVGGDWLLGNQYKTSEFVTDSACGTNSCNETIYCLPADASLEAFVKAAALLSTDGPEAVFPYTGVVDMAGNSLDGNSNGIAEGEIIDYYSWTFSTNDEIVLVPPHVTGVVPALSGNDPASDVDFDAPVRVTFDSPLQMSTLNSGSLYLHSPSDSLWFTLSAELLGPDDGMYHEVTVNHGVFSDERVYGAEVASTLKSGYQNCFTPSTSTACTGPNCCNDLSSSSECAYPTFEL